jgi:hypothetical protein
MVSIVFFSPSNFVVLNNHLGVHCVLFAFLLYCHGLSSLWCSSCSFCFSILLPQDFSLFLTPPIPQTIFAKSKQTITKQITWVCNITCIFLLVFYCASFCVSKMIVRKLTPQYPNERACSLTWNLKWNISPISPTTIVDQDEMNSLCYCLLMHQVANPTRLKESCNHLTQFFSFSFCFIFLKFHQLLLLVPFFKEFSYIHLM